MGCWNATCNVSNLPIFWGDKVVLIPLVKVSSEHTKFNPCYPTDNFIPLGFPIFGEYDDYGRLENAHTTRWNEAHLRQFKYYFENCDDDAEKYRPVELRDDFNEFVGQVLCCHEGCYIDINNKYFHPDGKAMVTYMMIHQDIYDALLSEMANRTPYNHDCRLHDALMQKLDKQLVELLDDCPCKEDCLKPEIYDAFVGIMLNNVCSKVFGYDNYFHQRFIWKDLARILVSDTESRHQMLSYIAEMKTWTLVLSYLRKGYLSDSGGGSQSGEMKLHLVLAQSIQRQVEKARQLHDWDESSDAEEIYLW